MALSTAVYKHMCPELSKQGKDERTETFLLEMGVNSWPQIPPHAQYPHRQRWMRVLPRGRNGFLETAITFLATECRMTSNRWLVILDINLCDKDTTDCITLLELYEEEGLIRNLIGERLWALFIVCIVNVKERIRAKERRQLACLA